MGGRGAHGGVRATMAMAKMAVELLVKLVDSICQKGLFTKMRFDDACVGDDIVVVASDGNGASRGEGTYL